MASEIVHAFGVLGTKAVIQTGNCGAIGDGFEAGDILLADRAFCGEGAAQYYKPDSKWVDASRSLLEKAAARFGPGGCRVGAIYTTGALLAEGMEDLDRWHREGFAAVDLETAATYAVAEHFGMDRLAILYAFDNPRRKEHILLTDSEKDVRRGEANARVRDMVLALAAESGLQY
jgi:purine-nucleoside phosphorylase